MNKDGKEKLKRARKLVSERLKEWVYEVAEPETPSGDHAVYHIAFECVGEVKGALTKNGMNPADYGPDDFLDLVRKAVLTDAFQDRCINISCSLDDDAEAVLEYLSGEFNVAWDKRFSWEGSDIIRTVCDRALRQIDKTTLSRNRMVLDKIAEQLWVIRREQPFWLPQTRIAEVIKVSQRMVSFYITELVKSGALVRRFRGSPANHQASVYVWVPPEKRQPIQTSNEQCDGRTSNMKCNDSGTSTKTLQDFQDVSRRYRTYQENTKAAPQNIQPNLSEDRPQNPTGKEPDWNKLRQAAETKKEELRRRGLL